LFKTHRITDRFYPGRRPRRPPPPGRGARRPRPQRRECSRARKLRPAAVGRAPPASRRWARAVAGLHALPVDPFQLAGDVFDDVAHLRKRGCLAVRGFRRSCRRSACGPSRNRSACPPPAAPASWWAVAGPWSREGASSEVDWISGAGSPPLYNDVYVRTEAGWRFKSRTYCESTSGEPVQPPPALVAAPAALRVAPRREAAGPSRAGASTLTVDDYIETN
jgi:hypothetical protein